MPRIEDMTPEDRAALDAEAARLGTSIVEMELPSWVGFGFEHREIIQRRCPDAPGMPPVAAALSSGQYLAIVVADQVDRDLGLSAVLKLRVGLDPDELIVAFDTFSTTVSDEQPGLPRGSLQRLHEAGFDCELAPIREAIAVFRLLRGGAVEMARLPYRGPRDGAPLVWEGDQFLWTGKPGGGIGNVGGDIAAALARIAALPALIDEPAAVAMRERLGFSREQALFHCGRAALRMLGKEAYVVIDVLTRTHPEWLDAGTPPIDEEEESGDGAEPLDAPHGGR